LTNFIEDARDAVWRDHHDRDLAPCDLAGHFMTVIYNMHEMHVPDFEFTEIRLIAELLERRKLSAAAARLGLSQSAASHALARLRKRFGDPLFTRSAGDFQPTPYGERLGIAAREALEVLVAGVASNRPFDPCTTTRRFTLYANDVGQMVLLPRLLAFLKKEAPGATLRTSPIPLENPGAAMVSGDVDAAAGFFDNLTTGFRQSLLFRERYVCAVRANHPKFRTGMTLEAFKTNAMADATGMAHAVIDRFLAKQRIQRNVVLRVPGFHVLPMIIANSDLLAVIPGRLAEAFVSHVPIKVLPLPISVPPFDIRIYWHERYHHDSALCWFRTAFIKLFRVK
jgi:DNA-binding transcriptional LysR family regulator